jgi:hypothetical protein
MASHDDSCTSYSSYSSETDDEPPNTDDAPPTGHHPEPFRPRAGGGSIAPPSEHGSDDDVETSSSTTFSLSNGDACEYGPPKIKLEKMDEEAQRPASSTTCSLSASDACGPPNITVANVCEEAQRRTASRTGSFSNRADSPSNVHGDLKQEPMEEDPHLEANLRASIIELQSTIAKMEMGVDGRIFQNARDATATRPRKKATRKARKLTPVDPTEIEAVDALTQEFKEDAASSRVARGSVIMASCVPSYCVFFVFVLLLPQYRCCSRALEGVYILSRARTQRFEMF